jgi:putative nucleotidyltransferase with HDIG domain
MELGINYNQAKELLDKYIKDPITKMHCLESEAIMRALAKKFGEDEDKWGIIGLLHDIDWELTKDNPKEHCVKAVDILKQAGASDYLIETVVSHGYGHALNKDLKSKQRTTKVQHALAAAETLTGLIVASALVQPDKKLNSVKLNSLKKKFKSKSFAANCDRDVIMECEKIGLTLDEFLEIGLKALQGISEKIGL